jgi:hypothetical protein
MFDAAAAHVGFGLQARTDRRSFRFAEQTAAIIAIELNASHASGLAVRHTRDG